MDGCSYYIAAQDYDASCDKRGYSNEVITTIPVVSYTMTATSGSNGAIIPSSNPPVSLASNNSSLVELGTVNSSASQSFTITPSSGYQVAAVSVDGVSVGAVSSNTVIGVTANPTIYVTFKTKRREKHLGYESVLEIN